MTFSQLKLLVLQALKVRACSGYTLIQQISHRTGCWKPSTGSMYPLLERLKQEGAIRSRRQGRRVLYGLTAQGRRQLAQLQLQHVQVMTHLLEDWKVLAAMFPENRDAPFMISLFDALKRQDAPFREIQAQLFTFRSLIGELYVHQRIRKEKERINAILAHTNEQLRRLL